MHPPHLLILVILFPTFLSCLLYPFSFLPFILFPSSLSPLSSSAHSLPPETLALLSLVMVWEGPGVCFLGQFKSSPILQHIIHFPRLFLTSVAARALSKKSRELEFCKEGKGICNVSKSCDETDPLWVVGSSSCSTPATDLRQTSMKLHLLFERIFFFETMLDYFFNVVAEMLLCIIRIILFNCGDSCQNTSVYNYFYI